MAAFDAALCDDLNTPRALSALWMLIKDPAVEPAAALTAAFTMDRIFGLSLREQCAAALEAASAAGANAAGGEAAEVGALIERRSAAKKAKNFAEADKIRAELNGRGIILEDTPQGTVWRRG